MKQPTKKTTRNGVKAIAVDQRKTVVRYYIWMGISIFTAILSAIGFHFFSSR